MADRALGLNNRIAFHHEKRSHGGIPESSQGLHKHLKTDEREISAMANASWGDFIEEAYESEQIMDDLRLRCDQEGQRADNAMERIQGLERKLADEKLELELKLVGEKHRADNAVEHGKELERKRADETERADIAVERVKELDREIVDEKQVSSGFMEGFHRMERQATEALQLITNLQRENGELQAELRAEINKTIKRIDGNHKFRAANTSQPFPNARCLLHGSEPLLLVMVGQCWILYFEYLACVSRRF